MGQDLYWNELDIGTDLSVWDAGMDGTVTHKGDKGEELTLQRYEPQQLQHQLVGPEEWSEMVHMMESLDERESTCSYKDIDSSTDTWDDDCDDDETLYIDETLYVPVKMEMKTCTKSGVLREKYWLYCENTQKNWVVPCIDFTGICSTDERFVKHQNGQWLFAETGDLDSRMSIKHADGGTKGSPRVSTRVVLHQKELLVSTTSVPCITSELYIPGIGNWGVVINVSTFENDSMMHPRQGVPEYVQVSDIELVPVPPAVSPLGFTCGFKITGRQQGWFKFTFEVFLGGVLFAKSEMAPVMLNNPRISKKPLRNYSAWKVWLMNTYISIVGTKPMLDPAKTSRLRAALAREVCMRRGTLEDTQDIITNSYLAMPRPRARKYRSTNV